MEFFFLVTSSTLGEDVMLQFKHFGIANYTQIPLANGSGVGGGTKFGNDIWPGENTVFFCATETEKYNGIVEWVKNYRSQEIREGMKIINLAFKEII